MRLANTSSEPHCYIHAVRIFNQIGQVQDSTITRMLSDIKTLFPSLFAVPWKFSGSPHEIQLQKNAVPFFLSVHVSRRIPLPLMSRVQAALERLQHQHVIRKIEEPTDWCAAMVVEPKTNGNVPICAVFTLLT